LEKITTLLEDIFEAEDALAPDADLADLPAEFFSRLSADCAHPLLQRNLIRKLSKYVDQVARPTKRLRLSNREGNAGGGSTPRHHGRVAEIDAFTLSRLLKILHRSVRLGEDLDPFVNAHEKVATPRKSIGHNVSQNKADKLEEHHGQHNYTMLEGPSEASPQITGLPDTDLDHLITMLDVARDSILAADCCIALLGSDRLTKEVSGS
jgi:cohesin loading factor subunit SCC2